MTSTTVASGSDVASVAAVAPVAVVAPSPTATNSTDDVGGESFTLYTISSENRDGDDTPFARTTILVRYEGPSPGARLGAFVWRVASASSSSEAASSAESTPTGGVLPVHLISDVFLGMQTSTFDTVRSRAVPVPVEDHCFSLVSKAGSLDLEGPSIEATKAFLKQLSRVINSSGKDIVLAGESTNASASASPARSHATTPPLPLPSAPPTVPEEVEADTLSPSPATPNEGPAAEWKVQVDSVAAAEPAVVVATIADTDAVPNVEATQTQTKTDAVVASSPAPAHVPASAVESAPSAVAAAAPTSRAQDLMTGSGAGFPFTLHYFAHDGGLLTRTGVLMTFVPSGAGANSASGGGHFLLKTGAPSLRPTQPHACLTEPHAFSASSDDALDGQQSGDLCIWEAPLTLDAISDVYINTLARGTFAAAGTALAHIDPARVVSLVTDQPEPPAHWDLEAASSEALVDWLAAFNHILQQTEQEVAIAEDAAPQASAPGQANAGSVPSIAVDASSSAPSSTTSASLASLRSGSYFWLYTAPTAGVGATTRALIFLFYSDARTRPLHHVEARLAADQPRADENMLRSSLFYRYVGSVDESTAAGQSAPTPRDTDECLSIFHVSDLLLGRQTPLLCHSPLTTFVPNAACFSLVVSRPERGANGATRIVATELGLECVEPSDMPVWLEGIMEVSNRAGGDITAPGTPNDADRPAVAAVAVVADTTSQKPLPPLRLPSSSSTTSSTSASASDRLMTIEHVVSSPRVSVLHPADPTLRSLARGVVLHSWEDYDKPARRKVLLFYANDEKPNASVSNTNDADATSGGAFYWNYLEDSYEGFEPPASEDADAASGSSRFYARNAHRSFTIESLQSVYRGRVARIFQKSSWPKSAASSAASGSLLSLLTGDDILNLESASPAALDTFLTSLKYVLSSVCAKNLIQVPLGPTGGFDNTNEVAEWYNIQEAVFPVTLASAAVVSPPMANGEGAAAEDADANSRGSDDALMMFARGQAFQSWSLSRAAAAAATDAAEVVVAPITLFVQQTPVDGALFFVAARGHDASEVARAKTWSRRVQSASELRATAATTSSSASGAAYPFLLLSDVSDLHIGKNLPIFAASRAGAALVADECVSIVAAADAETNAGAGAVRELHLVATEGIGQIARTISAVTGLLERDGVRLPEPIWRVLRGDDVAEGDEGAKAVEKDDSSLAASSATTIVPKKLDFSDATPLLSSSPPPLDPSSSDAAGDLALDAAVQALAPATEDRASLLRPLRAGATFWLWSFANAADADAQARQVQRREVHLQWRAATAGAPATDLGVLAWRFVADAEGEAVAESGVGTLAVSAVSDIWVGCESGVFASTHSVASVARNGVAAAAVSRFVTDESCFSVLGASGESGAAGTELHLESEQPSTVSAWVDGLSMLLESGGRSLTEEPTVSADAATTTKTNDAAPAAAASTPAASAASSPAVAAVAASAPAVAVAPATNSGLVVPSEPLPVLPASPQLGDVLRVVHVLSRAADERKLIGYAASQVEAAIAAIRDAAATQPPELMDSVMSSGAARVVVECMRAFSSFESVQLVGAGACWCLATTAENEALVVAAGGLDVNRANLQRFPSSPMLLQQSCGAVRNLTVADAHKELFCAGDHAQGVAACAALVAALETHADATALAQQASGSIAALAMHPPNKTLLGEAGAVRAIVRAMQAHRGSDAGAMQVHEECCAALRNLAANHAPNKEAIASCGGVAAIVESMRTHRESAVNQLHAAGALWNVPANNAPNKAAVAACGGIAALLDAIETHAEDAEVQLECVGSLRNLSTLVDNKPLLLAAGVVPIVLAAMKRQVDAPLLQEQACALLFNLANYASDAQASVLALIDRDAPRAILEALARHVHVASVVEEACAALWIIHRAAASAGVEWPEAFTRQVLALADAALDAHANATAVVNFAAGMKSAWSAPSAAAVANAHANAHANASVSQSASVGSSVPTIPEGSPVPIDEFDAADAAILNAHASAAILSPPRHTRAIDVNDAEL